MIATEAVDTTGWGDRYTVPPGAVIARFDHGRILPADGDAGTPRPPRPRSASSAARAYQRKASVGGFLILAAGFAVVLLILLAEALLGGGCVPGLPPSMGGC